MFRIGLKSLWAHKRRLIGTSLSVILGIAFLTGTIVMGDTLRASFDELFTNVNRGTDAVVRSSTEVKNEGFSQRPPVEVSLLDQVRKVPGVADAQPDVSGYGVLVGKDGKQVTTQGPPLTAGNWIGNSPLNPYQLAQGRAPKAPNEAIIDRGLAKKSKLGIGDSTTVQLPDPFKITIVGIATFGGADSAAGQTFTGLTTRTAQQQILKSTSMVSSIRVKAAPGVSQTQLSDSLNVKLPKSAESITGTALTKQQKDEINSGFLDFLTNFLKIFAAIALLVAVFSIYNTFTIIMAQRTQEAALLRALGASRRQVLSSVLVETFLVGVVGAVIGLAAGLLVALGLSAMFQAFGADLPTHSLIITPGTIAIGLVVGVLVTVLAGLIPAVRSSRVAPLAALRDVAVDESGASVARLAFGAIVSIGALALIFVGVSSKTLTTTGYGGGLLLLGIVVLGPVVAKPSAAVLGAPAAAARGVAGELARENAKRNPRRTAGTASALLVGVAVVSLITVVGASLVASVNNSVDKAFAGDLVVSSGGFGGGQRGFSPELANKVSQVPQVQQAAGIGFGVVKVNNFIDSAVSVAKPVDLAKVLNVKLKAGDFAGLSDQQVAVSKSTAKTFKLGSSLEMQLPDGTKSRFTVGAIYDNKDILRTDYVVPSAAYAPHAPQVLDQSALIKLKPGVTLAQGQKAVEKVAKGFPGVKVQNRSEYRDSISQGVASFLALVYAMLFLAVVIALFGIANTLSLSVYERTREIGLLRAVGGLRRQVRSMVRWESVVISLFGTVGGVGLGLFLAWALINSDSGDGGANVFDPGLPQLVIVLVVGALVGVLAAIRPARRASRLDVLRAINQ